METRVVVTGSSGFIGRHLVRLLGEQGHTILPVDRKTGDDLLDDQTLRAIYTFQPHHVYHLAAEHFIPWCDKHPEETVANNTGATLRLLDALPRGAHRVVMASSAAVYGFSDQPFSEKNDLRPLSIYGITKVQCELALSLWSERGGMSRGFAARLFNVVGPGDETPHLFTKLARERARGERETTLGTMVAVRDYVHVYDVVDALYKMGQVPSWSFEGDMLPINVATGVGTNVADVAAAFGFHRVFLGEGRKVEGNLLGDPTRADRVLEWKPKHTWRDAIRDL